MGAEYACKVLVLVSFDPEICLKGVPQYPGAMPKARPAGKWVERQTPYSPRARQSPPSLIPISQPSSENRPMYEDIGRGYHFSQRKKE